MSATQELIAAALRLAALAERNTDDRDEWQHAIDSVREACARAMVQPAAPDVVVRPGMEGWKEATIAWEVCASIHREYAKKKDPFFTTRQSDFVKHAEAARAKALTPEPDMAERDDLIADNERLMQIAAQRDHIGDVLGMVPAPAALRRCCDMGVGCETVGVCYAEAHGRPELCPETHIQPQSVELPEPDQVIGHGWDARSYYGADQMRTYGDAREAAGYAAGVAAGWKDAERYRVALLACARKAEALKQDCGADPESAQAIRNAQYQAISTTAHIALGTIRLARFADRKSRIAQPCAGR